MKFTTPLSVNDLLAIINQEVIPIGSQSQSVMGINEIHSVEAGDLSFVDHPKYYDRMMKSKADFILINQKIDFPDNKTLLVCSDPLQAYLDVVHHFVKFTPQNTAIHPDTKIGKGTIIQPNVFIGENVTIGENCIIHSNVSIYANSIIGNNVIIHSASVIGADACYFQKRENGWLKIDSCGRTIIEDNVEIGCNVCIDKGVSGDTIIGEGTIFDNLVQVGHDTIIGKYCLLAAQSAVAGCTFVDDNTMIWAKAGVNKDLYVAKNTTLLACSAIDKSVETEGSVLFGIPAQEARTKWKEMSLIRRLPELYEEVKQLQSKLNSN